MKRKIEGTKIEFTFEDNLAPVVFDATLVSNANREYAVMHGFNQRIGDNAAIARKDVKTGKVITVTETMRRDAVLELVNHYHSGSTEWALGVSPRINPIVAKLAERLGITYEEAAKRDTDSMLDELMGKE